MTTRRPQLLYRREIDGKVLTLTEKAGVYELSIVQKGAVIDTPEGRDHYHRLPLVAVSLVDPTYSQPVQQGRRT